MSTQANDVMESLARIAAERDMKADRSLDGDSIDISIVRRPGQTTLERTARLCWEGDRGWFVQWGITARRALAVEEPNAASKLLEAVDDVFEFMDREVRAHIEDPPIIRHSR